MRAIVNSNMSHTPAPADAYAWEPDRDVDGYMISEFRWQTMTELRALAQAGNQTANDRLAKLEAAYRELGFDLQEASAGETCSACGRSSWDCSNDPCLAVLRDRSESVDPAEPEVAFRCYQRTSSIEARPYVPGETLSDRVSISPADREAGSPKLGDMIARNPANQGDQWLIAAAYFAKHHGKAKGNA